MRTYRLAVAATGEYTFFHGGTAQLGLAAIGVTMNRVGGIYERDFAVRFTLVPNNDLLVFTNAVTDPYTNGDVFTMLGENQATIDLLIGQANYDIGHVFGTNSGGVAGFGVTCVNGLKAWGATGGTPPIGDPFDVDYVAHEIGHQFGASHSYNNSCNGNRSDEHAVEPGSGSTIMSYSGICAPNVQNNSNDYYHGINMRQIGIRISNDVCASVTSLNNTMPQIPALPAEIMLPVSTPFALTAPASDAEGDALTWCWEQMNNEISQQPPVATAATGPNFRTFPPAPSPTRYLPRLQTLALNQPQTWERLPSVTRTMNFRVSVRDNAPGGGCTQFADLQVSFHATAGPFVVTNPNTNQVVWQGLSYYPVTWNVANTTAAPILAQFVNIYLSTDGGLTFPILLAENVPNTGAATVQAPNVSTSQARVMVQSSQGTFFDISDFNFTITQINNGFAFNAPSLSASGCQQQPITFAFDAVAIGNFEGSIDLNISNVPAGADAVLSTTAALPGETVILTLLPSTATLPGTYDIIVNGNGNNFSNSIVFTGSVIALAPVPATPQSPANGSQGVDVNPVLNWTANAGPGETYSVQVATDAAFANLVFTAQGLSANEAQVTGLTTNTTYYWRVQNSTPCGTSPWSSPASFTTFVCNNFASAGSQTIPADIEGQAVSTIQVNNTGTVGAVRVKNIQGQHPNISDLQFRLKSPSGTAVSLAAGFCGLNVTLFGNQTIAVSNPPSVAGTYVASPPGPFGPGIGGQGVSGVAVLADDGGAAAELCEPAINQAALQGRIAICFRGGCNFVTKVLNAQAAGAIAVIIINNQGGSPTPLDGTSTQINIPSVMIGLVDGQNLLAAIGANAANFNFSFDDQSTATSVVCPATGGLTYPPASPLSVLIGENVQGTWQLEVVNLSGIAQGTVNSWNLELCLQGPISVNNAQQTQFKAWPNPTADVLNLNATAPMLWVEVTDLAGRLIERMPAHGQPALAISTAPLSGGVYFVTAYGDGWKRTVRLVKTQ
jgi:subtilisin-like proprotein convertase family protein